MGMLLTSCLKEGEGGKARLNVYVFRDSTETLCKGCNVYIFYGEESSKSLDSNFADDFGTTDVFGKVEFEPLRRGHYAFYASGYDSTFNDFISGETVFELENKVDERNVTIIASPK